MRIALVTAFGAVLATACGSVIPESGAIRVPYGDSEIRMLDTGAVIVGKRQVGTVRGDGKIVNSNGKLVAWVHEESIRLPGGASLPIDTDKEGTFYLPRTAQEQAQLEPITFRVRADGRLTRMEGARGVQIDGAHSAKNRRIVLALLLLTANKRWGPPGN